MTWRKPARNGAISGDMALLALGVGCVVLMTLGVMARLAKADAPAVRLQKEDQRLILTVEGATDLDFVQVAPGRFVIFAVTGTPGKLSRHTLLIDADAPPQPETPEAVRKVREWLALVPPESRGAAGALADAFLSVAKRIEAGELKTPAEIVAASKAANNAALGDGRNAWLPFFEKLRDYMNAEAEAGRLVSAADHARLFKQIAEGLRP